MSSDHPAFPDGPGWRHLTNSASVVVVRVNPAGVILAANEHAENLIGEPLVGREWHTMLLNFRGILPLAEWLSDPARPRLLNVRTGVGVPQTLQVEVEPDGEDYLLFGEVNAAEHARLEREVLELNHELNNLTRELAVSNADLAHLNALKNQFLGMAAHDLRKPAGLILSYSEFLIDEAGAALSPEHLDFLQTIHSSAGKMRQVVDDFLDVSLIEAGRFDVDVQVADLEALAKAAVTLVKLTAARAGVGIVTALDPATRSLVVDGPKLEQVLTNLLSNAVEHAPRGTTVTLASQRLPTEIRVTVRDHGPGISEVQRGRLFQSFTSGQLHKSSGERSAGLGLSIARKIVEAHGGRIFADTAVGQGSLFGFTLPLESPQ